MNELEYALRCVLYQARRNDFGCTGPKDDSECTCGKHLLLDGYEEPNADLMARIRFLTKIEGMQAVGCTFHLNDLDTDTWDDLIALKRARAWIDERVDEQRDRIRQTQELEKKGLDLARKELGTPGPGQSLFAK